MLLAQERRLFYWAKENGPQQLRAVLGDNLVF